MSVTENLALVRRWFKEVWNEGRAQTIHELMAEDAIAVGQDQPGVELHGPHEFEALFNRLHGAFPDMKFTIEDAFGADDKVVARWSVVMTHTGNQLGMPATNKQVRITGISIVRIENGKLMQGWDNWDQLALMQQLSDSAAAAG
jgi:steroid delta-isomerase-like uncharacterized protein